MFFKMNCADYGNLLYIFSLFKEYWNPYTVEMLENMKQWHRLISKINCLLKLLSSPWWNQMHGQKRFDFHPPFLLTRHSFWYNTSVGPVCVIYLPYADFRLRGFIFCSLWKSLLWMSLRTSMLEGEYLSLQILFLWRCQMLQKCGTCCPSRKFLLLPILCFLQYCEHWILFLPSLPFYHNALCRSLRSLHKFIFIPWILQLLITILLRSCPKPQIPCL